jgi:tetratricopeptide (TPR) repeat protein
MCAEISCDIIAFLSCNRDLMVYPDNVEYREQLFSGYFHLARLLSGARRYDEAEEVYRRVIEIGEELAKAFPEKAIYRQALAYRYEEMGRFVLKENSKYEEALTVHRRAIEICQKLTEEDPTNAEHWLDLVSNWGDLGQVLNIMKKFDEMDEARMKAIEIYEKLMIDYPQEHRYRIQLARKYAIYAELLCDREDPAFRYPARAIELAQKAVEINPYDITCWNTLSIAHCRAGNWEDVVTAFDKALKLSSGTPDIRDNFMLAMAHWQLGNKDKARQLYDKAIEQMNVEAGGDLPAESWLRWQAEAAELLGLPKLANPAEKEVVPEQNE